MIIIGIGLQVIMLGQLKGIEGRSSTVVGLGRQLIRNGKTYKQIATPIATNSAGAQQQITTHHLTKHEITKQNLTTQNRMNGIMNDGKNE